MQAVISFSYISSNSKFIFYGLQISNTVCNINQCTLTKVLFHHSIFGGNQGFIYISLSLFYAQLFEFCHFKYHLYFLSSPRHLSPDVESCLSSCYHPRTHQWPIKAPRGIRRSYSRPWGRISALYFPQFSSATWTSAAYTIFQLSEAI